MAFTKERSPDASGSHSACVSIFILVKHQFEWSTRLLLTEIRKRISCEGWECRSPFRYARNREIAPCALLALTAEYGRSRYSPAVAALRRRPVNRLQVEASLHRTRSGMISNSRKPLPKDSSSLSAPIQKARGFFLPQVNARRDSRSLAISPAASGLA